MINLWASPLLTAELVSSCEAEGTGSVPGSAPVQAAEHFLGFFATAEETSSAEEFGPVQLRGDQPG